MKNEPIRAPTPTQAAARPAIRRIGNLIAVASGKGGVGKTWFSVTLSHCLGRIGARPLLVDGDLGLANVDVQLGITPGHDLAAVIAGTVPVRDAIHQVDGGAKSGRGFDVLAGRSGSGALGALKPEELGNVVRLIEGLAKSYSHVVLDLGAGIDAPVRAMCAAAGLVLVVLTDEPTSLTDAYALTKVLKLRDPATPLEVVVNLVESPSQGRRTYQALAHACRSFLGQEPQLAGIVRRDKLVKEAIRQQTPLLVRYPQSHAVHDIEALANLLKDRKAPEITKA
jgi:flagellar biosynthesis protein FlhG